MINRAAATSLSAKFRLAESREHALVIDSCHGQGDRATAVCVLHQELWQAHSAPFDDGREEAAHAVLQGSCM